MATQGKLDVGRHAVSFGKFLGDERNNHSVNHEMHQLWPPMLSHIGDLLGDV